jgi:hypothetical protein
VQRWPPTQAAQRIEHKHGNIGIEGRAVVGHAMVLTVHRAGGGAQAAAAGVFKALTGRKRGLLADHAGAFDFFGHAIGIVDIPTAGDELSGDVAGIDDGDRVGKAKHAHAGRRLLGQVLRAGGDGELWASHGAMVALNATRSAMRLRGGFGYRLCYCLALGCGDDGNHQSELIEKHLRHTLRIAV